MEYILLNKHSHTQISKREIPSYNIMTAKTQKITVSGAKIISPECGLDQMILF